MMQFQTKIPFRHHSNLFNPSQNHVQALSQVSHAIVTIEPYSVLSQAPLKVDVMLRIFNVSEWAFVGFHKRRKSLHIQVCW